MFTFLALLVYGIDLLTKDIEKYLKSKKENEENEESDEVCLC